MSASHLPHHLAAGLEAVAAQPRPLRELATAGQPLCDDLHALPVDVAYVATYGKARGLERLRALPHLTALWASAVTPGLLAALSGHPRLRALHLYQIGRTDLAALGDLPALEHLLIGWAPQLTTLAWLARFPSLQTLSISDAKRLDFATLPTLPLLRAFDLQGGLDRTLTVPSYAPILRVPGVEYVAFPNVRAADGDLQCFANLAHLRELALPNFYPAAECARLAGRCPTVVGQTLRPIFSEPVRDAGGRPVFVCPKCGGPRLMLTGKPARLLCPSCDQGRIDRHVSEWELARAAAGAT